MTRTWMGCVVNVAQPFLGHMRVHLGCRNIDVTKQFLHRTQIRTSIQEMGSKCVAKRMRRYAQIERVGLHMLVDDTADTAVGERLPAIIEKKVPVVSLA